MPNATIYSDQIQFENPTKYIWQDSSLCSQTNPEAFFIEKGGSYEPARGICARCVVRSNCLEKAMADEGDINASLRFGMFGGLTPQERYALYLEQKDSEEAEEEKTAQIAA